MWSLLDDQTNIKLSIAKRVRKDLCFHGTIVYGSKTAARSRSSLHFVMLWLSLCLNAFQMADAQTVAIITPKDSAELKEELKRSGCLDLNPQACTVNEWNVSKVIDLSTCKSTILIAWHMNFRNVLFSEYSPPPQTHTLLSAAYIFSLLRIRSLH